MQRLPDRLLFLEKHVGAHMGAVGRTPVPNLS